MLLICYYETKSFTFATYIITLNNCKLALYKFNSTSPHTLFTLIPMNEFKKVDESASVCFGVVLSISINMENETGMI